jgi:hypothetical protein
MPLPPQGLRDAKQTATRLIQLLPVYAVEPAQSHPATQGPSKLPRWVPMSAVAVMAAIVIGTALYMAPNAQDAPVVPLSASPPSAPAH